MMMERCFNFNAGPAALPEEILAQAKDDILNWQSLGCGILEIGHRTSAFMDLLEETTVLLQSILGIPKGFEVLWLGLPSRLHFSAIPMNFLKAHEKAGYVISGMWSEMAFAEAERLFPNATYCAGSGKENGFRQKPLDCLLESESKYLYFTPNETVHGVRYTPSSKIKLPLVADMTSCILSETIDFNRYACIFAGAQKNIANAGLSVVIVREDFLVHQPQTSLPLTLDYRTHVKHHSLYVTPPTFNIYLANLMLKWLQKEGGLAHFAKLTEAKAKRLYDAIDSSTLFQAFVEKDARSPINVCFTTGSESRDAAFLDFAQAHSLIGLKGHRAVGGLRASLYNAVSMTAVESLVNCLQEFEKIQNGLM